MKFLRKLRTFFRKDALDAEMAEEMRLHVELQADLNLKAGMNPEDARYAAPRQFGNVASIQEQAREQRGWFVRRYPTGSRTPPCPVAALTSG